MSEEKIVCGAVKMCFGDKVKIDLCIRYPDGVRMGKGRIFGFDYELGFVTNKERFVSQEEALEISGLGSQLRFKDRKYLLPEDLY